MKTERQNFSESPDRLAADGLDCIWIRLAPREKPSPFTSRALQWLDWELQGALSRLVVAGKALQETTFLPTMRRISVPLVAIDGPSSSDWQSFLRNCRGMKLKRVLYFCEEAKKGVEYERELKALSSEDFPEVVVFGSD